MQSDVHEPPRAFARIDDFLMQDDVEDDAAAGVRHPFELDTVDAVDFDIDTALADSWWGQSPFSLTGLRGRIDVDPALAFADMSLYSDNDYDSHQPPQFASEASTFYHNSEAHPEVCRHLLAGGCYRSDCWFSHDVSSIPCKFYLSGYCMRGDECPFLHQISPPYNDQWSPKQSAEGDEIVRINDDTVDLQATPAAFPSLVDRKSTTSSAFDFWGPTAPYSEVLSKRPDESQSHIRGPGVAKVAAAGTAVRLMSECASRDDSSERRKVKVDNLRWVSTGGAVDALYTKQRQEAAEAAEARNRLFQRAAEMYRTGNMAAAKNFSAQAREMDLTVQRLNREAGDRIFSLRNSALVAGGATGNALSATSMERIIDLHGLHGDEAVHYVESAIDALRRESFEGKVTIITGTGHHSRGSFAKVSPQIRAYLKGKKFSFQEGTLKDGRGGLFVVRL
ncbi:hypothetical protein HDU84_005194 [Entophlyctis sp. JEL0112]|nr:hypothetical protein HDU84_005194 [Entophlyctis sp. JEL0112]